VIARNAHSFTDVELAELARSSVEASFAPDQVRRQVMSGIDRWLAQPTPS
jgi:adenosine deaminase